MKKIIPIILIILIIPTLANAGWFDWFSNLFQAQPLSATLLFPTGGGTGTGTKPKSGQLLIGNASSTYTPNYLTAGTSITITTSSGGITINSTASGGGATTTINGLSTTDYTFTAGSNMTIATSAPGTITFSSTATGTLWSTSTGITYLTATTSDVVMGASVTASAPFWMDVSTGNLTLTGELTAAQVINANSGIVFTNDTQLIRYGAGKIEITEIPHGRAAVLDVNLIGGTTRTFQFPNINGTFITTGNLSDITTVGTIISGVWNGTAISNIYGGTGQNTSAWTGFPYITAGTWGTSTALTSESDPVWLAASSTYLTTASSTASYVRRNDWTTIDNYPNACTAGNVVQGLGDTLTCVGIGGSATTTINGIQGPTFTFNTANDTNIGLAISTTTGQATFTASWIGTLANARIASSSYWNTNSAIVAASSSYWDIAYNWGDWSGEGFITAGDVPANETDAAALAKFGTITDTKWCSASGTQVTCTENAPAGGGVSTLNELDGALTLWGTSPLTITASGTEGLILAYTEEDPIWVASSSDYYTSAEIDAFGFLDAETDPVWLAASSSYLTTASSTATYLTNASATATYLTQASSTATYLTQVSSTASYVRRGVWTTIDNYPSDCASNGVVYGLADTLSCYSTSTMRTNLALVIGTNVQAYDAGLNSIAGLTTGADLMIYTTAADTYATTALTAFGRSLIDDAAASNARTTLGLGTMAVEANTGSTTITTLGTISSGTWGGTAVSSTYGGTNQNSSGWTGVPYVTAGVWATSSPLTAIHGLSTAKGNLILGTGSTWAALATGTAGYILTASTTAANGVAWMAAPATSLSGGETNYFALWTSATTLGTTTLTTTNFATTGTFTAGDHLTLTGTDFDLDSEIDKNACGFSIAIYNASTTMDAVVQKVWESPVTITKVECSVNTSTASSTIQFDERAYATPSTAGTDVMSAALVCDGDSASTTAFDNATIAANAPLSLDIDAISGTVTALRIHVFCTNDE